MGQALPPSKKPWRAATSRAPPIGAHCQAFADSIALVAATFNDPTLWSSCKSPAFASTAAACEEVTGAYTFHDLALSGTDKGVYATLTGADAKAKVDVKALTRPQPLISNLLDVAGKHSQRALGSVSSDTAAIRGCNE